MAARDGEVAPQRSGSIGFAAAIGAVAGAALTGHRGARVATAGAVAGAVALGASERVARARQRPGEIPAPVTTMLVILRMVLLLLFRCGARRSLTRKIIPKTARARDPPITGECG